VVGRYIGQRKNTALSRDVEHEGGKAGPSFLREKMAMKEGLRAWLPLSSKRFVAKGHSRTCVEDKMVASDTEIGDMQQGANLHTRISNNRISSFAVPR